ncbi:class I SAM-dependent methyltransferase [Rhodoferax sp.]|uniref:class I SAM-dependent methyltransferase n=1 Tax=Rhodoferax sp. TaxID=50421 RepID=UPI001EC384F0|nr:class I SAM-dependent methyltransferase [Rhodoferax sp.]MBT9507349.1 class I SAM-dependent methyltransferase [Rhodoferax sp.]
MSPIQEAPVARSQSRSCPLCSGKAEVLFAATDENHHVSQIPYTYLKCRGCNGIFLENPPVDLGRYYRSDYYAIPSFEQLQKVADKDHNKIDTVRRFVTEGRLLEVGPAFGVFAWQAKQVGFVVDVIEMDARCCAYLQGTLGVNVTQSGDPQEAIKALPPHDVIAIWHVLEHLADPYAFLSSAAANLKPGGILVIAMPNPDAWQFKVMGRHWPHLDAPRHLFLIPEVTMTRLAAQVGLKKLFLTSDDSDAKSWNRFGWQRLLMNRFSSKFMQRVMFVLGYGISLFFAALDRQGFNGSAYTIIFRKNEP